MNNFKVLPKKLLCGGGNPQNLISFWFVSLPNTEQMCHLTGEINND